MSDASRTARESATRIGSRLLEALQYRLELFGLELSEEKLRILGALVAAGVATVLLFVGLLCLNVLVALLFLDNLRTVFVVLSAVYLGGGALLAAIVWYRVKNGPQPFAATLEELRKDASTFRDPS